MSLLRRRAVESAAGGRTFATWNPADKNPAITLTDGDRTAERDGEGWQLGSPFRTVRANIGKDAGKWYFEIYSPLYAVTANADEYAGVMPGTRGLLDADDTLVGLHNPGVGYTFRRDGGQHTGVQQLANGSGTWGSNAGNHRLDDGYMGMAVDFDAGRAWCVINGSWRNNQNPISAPAGTFIFTPGTTLFPAVSIQSGIVSRPEALYTINAGQDPFLNLASSAFEAGGVLEGFNPGWWQ